MINIRNYIEILMDRRFKIINNLSVILEKEFNLLYDDYSTDILYLFHYYQGKILNCEEENINLYDEFRIQAYRTFNKSKRMIKKTNNNQ